MKRQSRALPDSADSKAAYLLALRWLMARELSEGQVRERLARRGYIAEAIDPAVRRLLEERTIDDRRTATAVARTEARIRRRGPRRIMGKLTSIKIDQDLAKQVVGELFGESDEQELLQTALERRIRGDASRLKDPRDRQKVLAYLIRQGFSASAASNLLRKRSR